MTDPYKDSSHFRDVTPKVDLDLERARSLAWQATLDMGHHELAISDPFAAETAYQELGREIIKALGHPEDVRLYALDGACDD